MKWQCPFTPSLNASAFGSLVTTAAAKTSSLCTLLISLCIFLFSSRPDLTVKLPILELSHNWHAAILTFTTRWRQNTLLLKQRKNKTFLITTFNHCSSSSCNLLYINLHWLTISVTATLVTGNPFHPPSFVFALFFVMFVSASFLMPHTPIFLTSLLVIMSAGEHPLISTQNIIPLFNLAFLFPLLLPAQS